jgi:diacylglycerol kinase family enzyme
VQVTVVANPASGRGRALALADRFCVELGRRGGVPVRLPLDASRADFDVACAGSRAIVLVGGDGTVRSFASRMAGGSIPVAIVPTGTENLAAREFGFRCRTRTLLDAIERGRERCVDLGSLRTDAGVVHDFVVMASAGFDADVVAELDSYRRGPIARWSYLAPILRLAGRWVPPGVQATADGAGAERGGLAGAGQFVVANSRQYAVRLDPCRDADPADGQLDAVLMPCSSWRSLVGWAIRLSMTSRAVSGLPGGRAPAWTVAFDRPTRLQADGDPVPGGPVLGVQVSVRPGALRLVDLRDG